MPIPFQDVFRIFIYGPADRDLINKFIIRWSHDAIRQRRQERDWAGLTFSFLLDGHGGREDKLINAARVERPSNG